MQQPLQKALENFPEKNYYGQINYTGRGYSARIQRIGNEIIVALGKKWEQVSQEIQQGCIECLLSRLTKTPKKTINIELYFNFLKSLPKYSKINKTEQELLQSFERINQQHFNGNATLCNLQWKPHSNTLGTYNHTNNTIKISKKLTGKLKLLDYVMFHEMLHKEIGYRPGILRDKHHTGNFKQYEKQYPEKEEIEKELGKL